MVFQCSNCGGTSVFDPERQKMYCPYCGSEDSESVVPEKEMCSCPACGAPVQIGPYTSAGKCGSCGNYIIFDERINGPYEPHLILPFKFSKKQALAELEKEYNKRIFAPSDFIAESNLDKVEGMYVPFFMYDFHSNYEWSGRGNVVRTWTSGDTRYTETKVFHIERNIDVDFEKIPVDASIAMPDTTMDLLEPYDYQALENFKAKYMSGFYGECYNMPAVDLMGRAKKKVENDTESLLMGTVSGYSGVVGENKNMLINNTQTNYALLPVWVYSYQYAGQMYQFHVNGQTGKLIGKMPISKKKAVGYTLTVFGWVFTAVFLFFMIIGYIL